MSTGNKGVDTGGTGKEDPVYSLGTEVNGKNIKPPDIRRGSGKAMALATKNPGI